MKEKIKKFFDNAKELGKVIVEIFTEDAKTWVSDTLDYISNHQWTVFILVWVGIIGGILTFMTIKAKKTGKVWDLVDPISEES